MAEIIIAQNYDEMSNVAAEIVRECISDTEGCVLGLATGSTPVGMYEKLVGFFNDGLVDFDGVQTFNLDEYCGLTPDDPQSYRYFMNENLFNGIDIAIERTHVPSGVDITDSTCDDYENLISECGGIDIQVLGLGHNGHIGFNEPADHFPMRTHLVDLKQSTIEANSRFFDDAEDVPKRAITMGIGTIFSARKLLVLVSGSDKASIVKEVLEGPVTPSVPASIIQLHPNAIFVLDKDAASKL